MAGFLRTAVSLSLVADQTILPSSGRVMLDILSYTLLTASLHRIILSRLSSVSVSWGAYTIILE